MRKPKKNTLIQIENEKTIFSYFYKLFTIEAVAQLKKPDVFRLDIGESIAKARMAEIMRHLPKDIDDRLIKIGHDIYNSFNRSQSTKKSNYCDDEPVIGKKYFFTDATNKTLLDCHKEGILAYELENVVSGEYPFKDRLGSSWKHIIEARPIVFDDYAKVGEEYYFADCDVIGNPDLIDKIVKDKKLFKLCHIHKEREHPFQAGTSWKHVIRGI